MIVVTAATPGPSGEVTEVTVLSCRLLKSLEAKADIPIVPWGATSAIPGGWVPGGSMSGNNVQRFREGLMMSKAELARKAGLSTLTIDRVEAGRPCRLDTKRKILLALGLKISDKEKVFGSREFRAAFTMVQPEFAERS